MSETLAYRSNFDTMKENMATRPSSFEKGFGEEHPPESKNEIVGGPQPVQFSKEGEVIGSGPLRDHTGHLSRRVIEIPQGKRGLAEFYTRWVAKEQIPTIVGFLESIDPKHAEEAAEKLAEAIRALGHRIANASESKKELEDCINEAKKKLPS